MLKATGLVKAYYGIQILKNISVSIKKGSITALAGPNGAGKTTLLKIIAQILAPDSGEVLYSDPKANVKKYTGYVPQQNAFFYELTVRDNLNYWLNDNADNSLAETVERLELNGVMNKKASALSGGMQRRLNMAIGLVNRPRLLIMDEPLTGVDISTRLLFMRWLLELKQSGMTVIYSTHHTDEIVNTADDLIIMHEGYITYCGGLFDIQADIERFISGHIKI